MELIIRMEHRTQERITLCQSVDPPLITEPSPPTPLVLGPRCQRVAQGSMVTICPGALVVASPFIQLVLDAAVLQALRSPARQR